MTAPRRDGPSRAEAIAPGGATPALAALLSMGREALTAAGIGDAALEAEVLLRHAAGLSREALFAALREPASEGARRRFEDYVARRLAHEPSAYITGRREFFGLEIEVTPATLIPRPETETLVEAAIEVAKPRGRIRRGPVLADVGTGSGAVAIALALNVPRSDVHAVDVSAAALEVAARNVTRHGVDGRVYLHRGHLLTPLPEFVDVIVANLPYVATADWERLPPELREHEPRLALDGGADGLNLVRELLADAPKYLRPRGCVCIEFGDGQADAVKDAARPHFPGHSLVVRRDLAGRERVLVVAPQS